MKRPLLLALSLLLLSWSAAAHASYGYVKGRLLFYEANNDYCPVSPTRDCTGTNYPQSQYNSYLPVSQTKVFVENIYGELIGWGSSSTAGTFNIYWDDGGTHTLVRVYWRPEQKDDRFRIYHADGSCIKNLGSWFTPTAFTTIKTPQDLGDLHFGSATNLPVYSNLYDGAWRMWSYALSYSGRMQTDYHDVEILAYGNDDDCPTSCAKGSTLIELDSGAQYDLADRVLHEMGHIASEVSRDWGTGADYCRDEPGVSGSDCRWTMESAEWRSRSFEEGLASFIGDVALYWYNARPVLHGHSLEYSAGCYATDQTRWALSALRYLWDVYDTSLDASFTDDTAIPYWAFFETLAGYCNGIGDHCNDEGFANLDGRSSTDFQYNVLLYDGASTGVERDWNCAE